MIIESTYRLFDTASMLSDELLGSVVREVYMPHWYLDRWKKTQKKKKYFNKPADLVGYTFTAVDPYGKSLVFRFENLKRLGIEDKRRKTKFLACDLGQGVWRIKRYKVDRLDAKDNSIIFICDHNGYIYQLVFSDKRRQSIFEVKDHFHELEILKHYGPPIDSPQFSFEWLRHCIVSKPRKTVKSFLIDQSICAGITNRMASDILFFANLYPSMSPKDLNDQQIDRFFFAILVNYATYSKQHDYFQFSIYGKRNCPICSSEVIKMKMRWRVTFYCPKCQAIDYQSPKPITMSYVNEIKKIADGMPHIWDHMMQHARRQLPGKTENG